VDLMSLDLVCFLSPKRLRCLMVMLEDAAVVIRRRKALA
jgi:DNA-binding winged helix-turn-helix (wHTH) protein